ncbi:toprim domain-containing protein [Joostella sp.]|uniref:toprim domain-containing protein n=1 Tax=Joostella sp. TaxID=2231138 RepID=UPI003A92CA6A
MKTHKITCEIARNYCCIEALKKLGYHPSQQNEKQAWFLSPFRSESKASFKISKTLNRWYDHGAGIGGNVIDLVCLIKQCSIKEALLVLDQENTSFSFQQPYPLEKETSLQITKSIRIKHPALIQYLISRGIKLSVADEFCMEVHYSFKDKNYFAIGLKNISGGFELRNKIYKNSSSPKDITLIKNETKNLVICEGMFDLLTLASHHKNLSKKTNILVLNSISFVKRIIPEVENYYCIELYLDRDNAGLKATETLLKSSHKCLDMSPLYEGFQDINEWWLNREPREGLSL